MQVSIPEIPMREALHFLGWRGSALEEPILSQIQSAMVEVRKMLTAQVAVRHFALDENRCLADTSFAPRGQDVHAMLETCGGAILMAATLGAQSERLLLRYQAKSSAEALVMDAVLSAAIEAVCDEQERILRENYGKDNLHLTDRFSPGYGDMPLEQTREICAVLDTQKTIGLTVSHSGIMLPRKSVTAILGVSDVPQTRRPSQCAVCSMAKTCSLREFR